MSGLMFPENGSVADCASVELPAHLAVWLASPEARFLRGKILWANFDAEELLQQAEEIKSSRKLLWGVEGIPV
jgi:hypothetical protein